MTQPAAYTPATIRRIRDLSPTNGPETIGMVLGWDAEKVARIAAKHGVTFRRVAAPAPPASVDAPAPAPKPAEMIPAGMPITWDAAEARLCHGSATVRVGGKTQRPVLALLVKQSQADREAFITSRDIGDAVDMPHSHVPKAIAPLRQAIRCVGLVIEASMGPGGGYRLAPIKTAGEA